MGKADFTGSLTGIFGYNKSLSRVACLHELQMNMNTAKTISDLRIFIHACFTPFKAIVQFKYSCTYIE